MKNLKLKAVLHFICRVDHDVLNAYLLANSSNPKKWIAIFQAIKNERVYQGVQIIVKWLTELDDCHLAMMEDYINHYHTKN